MNRLRKEIVIVGGGPAGLAAGEAARQAGCRDLLIVERDKELGGILNQCIHNGFGLHTFKEELTGPEYADRYIRRVRELEIPYLLGTIVIDIRTDADGQRKIVTAMNREDGLFEIEASGIVLAMGCRERPRGALNIPGYRPAGIYSAGTAQRFVNMEGRMPGREVVILGSGDIGLIMARRMTLEGARVHVVAELMPYSGGLKRNIVQCLDDFDIPLRLSTTVVDIQGHDRVEGVTLAQVDDRGKPIPGTEEQIPCDTLLLSCGLIPENELSSGLGVEMNPVTNGPVVNESLETSIPGVFACGNVLHVHDLVDYVSGEAAQAGKYAAMYCRRLKGADHGYGRGGGVQDSQISGEEVQGSYGCRDAADAGAPENDVTRPIVIRPRDGVRYTVPSVLRPSFMEEKQIVRFRVGSVFRDVLLSVYFDDVRVICQKKRVMAPGEMEQVVLKKEDLLKFMPENIVICVEQQEALQEGGSL